MENSDLETLNNTKQSLNNKRKRLEEDTGDLRLEKALANRHRLALVKKENGQEVSQEEENAISDMKEAFPETFETEVSDSDSGANRTAEYIERKQVGKFLKKLRKDLDKNQEKCEIIYDKLDDIEARIAASTNTNPESSASENNLNPGAEVSKLQSPSDYIDSLPQEHNPFDDLGED